MIAGFDKAVGPVQPSERPGDLTPYRCQKGQADSADCSFSLYDGGPHRTFVHCTEHDYMVIAVDSKRE